MKFYIATSLLRAKDHNIVRDILINQGHTITYDWTKHGSVKCTNKETLQMVCVNEISGVKKAEIFIALIPGGFGTHVEIGAAIAYNKKIILLSSDEKYFLPCENTNAFYHHPNCTHIVSSLSNLNSLFDIINSYEKSSFLM